MSVVRPGDVLLIDKKHLQTIGHDKFAVCLCVADGLFFFINSKAWAIGDQQSQVQVLGAIELPFLAHTSYIDTSVMHQFPPHVVAHAAQTGLRGSLPQTLRERIKAAVKKSKTLSLCQKELVAKGL